MREWRELSLSKIKAASFASSLIDGVFSMKGPVVVEMRNINKSFSGVIANKDVCLKVRAGEIHALLGENGAGKSTLMNILSGFYTPDSGEIYVHGERVTLSNPREAAKKGIGMVHQHFKLVSSFTVAENIILGRAPGGLYLNTRSAIKEIVKLSREYGLEVHPEARIWQLSIGEQQRVEILKVLYRGAKVLILDEPTAVLTPQEAQGLFNILRQMAKKGCAVVLITHKLDEVMQIADTITVLRKGRVVGTVDKNAVDKKKLADMMVGREVFLKAEKIPAVFGEEVLKLVDITTTGDRGLKALKNVSLQVRKGEILGIAGVAGNGQKELAEVIAGLRKIDGGRVLFRGKDISRTGTRERIDLGIAFVPEDRLGKGLIPGMNIQENLILKKYRQPGFSMGAFLNVYHISKIAMETIEKFDIKIQDISSPVKLLSGGNLQKILLAREVSDTPEVLVTSYPVRGLDIKATEGIYNLLLEQKRRGCAIVFISEDLDALFQLSDRIAVLYGGEIMGVLPVQQTDINEIGLMMMGTKKMGVA